MKNFILLVITVATYAFLMAAAGSFLNYLFGLNLGMADEKIPADPVIGASFLVIAGICWLITFIVDRREKARASATDA